MMISLFVILIPILASNPGRRITGRPRRDLTPHTHELNIADNRYPLHNASMLLEELGVARTEHDQASDLKRKST
jgi:hypothetical protein